MSDYTELVKALRCPDFGDVPCSHPDCKYYDPYACKARVVLTDAAAAIEELLAFAHYVADKVTRSDDDWEDYHEAFAEVACRKLVKLGIVSVENDKYVYSAEVQE